MCKVPLIKHERSHLRQIAAQTSGMDRRRCFSQTRRMAGMLCVRVRYSMDVKCKERVQEEEEKWGGREGGRREEGDGLCEKKEGTGQHLPTQTSLDQHRSSAPSWLFTSPLLPPRTLTPPPVRFPPSFLSSLTLLPPPSTYFGRQRHTRGLSQPLSCPFPPLLLTTCPFSPSFLTLYLF